MAHFYGSMRGNRGEATRTGTKNSGFTAHIRCWDIGIRIDLYVDHKGRDVIEVYGTGGSNNPDNEGLLTRLKHPPLKLDILKD